MFRPGRKLLIALAVFAVCWLIAISAIVKLGRRGVSPTAQVTGRETPAAPGGPASKAASPAAEEEAPSEDAGDDILDSVLDDFDFVAYMEQHRRERRDKARQELREKLTAKWEIRQIPGRPQPVRVRVEAVSVEEQIRLYEEFLAEFPLSAETYGEGQQLARLYQRAGRIDDARGVYDDIVSVLPDYAFPSKQSIGLDRARMEAGEGNFGAAEDILRAVMDEPAPQRYREMIAEAPYDWTEMARNFRAPLQLADVYRMAGRLEDAENVLIQVADDAFAAPLENQSYSNTMSFASQAYQRRIQILFDGVTADEVDDVVETAGALIEEYQEKLEGREWGSPEQKEQYVRRYVDRMRRDAQRAAERIRRPRPEDRR